MNDVLALKRANLGIALQRGSQMTRSAAALVVAEARSTITVFATVCGILLLVFVAPPTRFWVGGSPLSGNWRPTMLAGGLLLGLGMVLSLPLERTFFEIQKFTLLEVAVIGGVALLWALVLRFIWRWHLLECVLGIEKDVQK